MAIRFATPADSPALLKIYGQYIETPVTFEYVLPTEQEFAGRIAGISQAYPYLVCEENNKITGYAYACRHLERAAYQWNAELSVYLDRSFTSRGLGKKLCRILIDILKSQGVRTVYGGVVAPNAKSEALHKALGFEAAGVYRNMGYKCGKWHDVIWFAKQIAPYDSNPQAVTPIDRISQEQIQKIILAAV